MKQKKLLTLFLTVATSFSMLVACSNATFAESTGTATVTESTNTTDKKQKADENQDAAKQLLVVQSWLVRKMRRQHMIS